MKRLLAIFFILIFLLCGCSGTIFDNSDETISIEDIRSDDDKLINNSNENEFRGAWLSYLEIRPKSYDMSEEDYSLYIESIFDNLSQLKINNVFVQVRPFADAIYPSELFPSSESVCKTRGDKLGFDFLGVIIKAAKKKSISVHAWINPFRVQKTFDEGELCDGFAAKKWFCEKGNTNVKKASGGLYFNPAKPQVHKLIIDGVKELLEKYDISGIHIDDYFYPTTDEAFDGEDYEAYKQSGGKMSLESWRRENISSLISSIYTTVKSYGKQKLFTVSPCGDIDKNENELYADCRKWCSEKGYCDIIIPQIYYGFENEKMPYADCLRKWKSLVCCDVKICAGLALYKAGKEDTFAGEGGKNEWKENSDIIKRQVELLRNEAYDGFCIYSAGFVNFGENFCGKEMKNLSDVVL